METPAPATLLISRFCYLGNALVLLVYPAQFAGAHSMRPIIYVSITYLSGWTPPLTTWWKFRLTWRSCSSLMLHPTRCLLCTVYCTLCSVTAYRILYCTHVTKYCPVTSLHYVTTWYCLYFLDLAFPYVEPVAWSGLQCPLLSVSGSIPPTLHTCTHSYYRPLVELSHAITMLYHCC